MKKNCMLLIVSALLLTTKISFAQWTTSGSDIYYTSGKVSVGTNTPVSGLSVETGSNITIAPLTSVPNGSAWIGSAGSSAGISIGQNTNHYGYIQSRNKNVNIGAYSLALNPLGGYVGVGKPTPVSTFHVSESTSTTDASNGITIEQTGSGDAVLQFLLPNVRRWSMGIDNSDNDSFKIGPNAGLATSPAITITTDGNIGIGTSTPTEKLYVRAEGLLRPTFESISTTDHYRAILDFKRSRGTNATKLPVAFNDKLGSIYFWGYDGTEYVESTAIGGVIETDASAGVVKSGIYFSTNDGSDVVNNIPKVKMYITSSGNVMINPKTDGQGNLALNSITGEGKLQVGGLIRAQEVKVETANWPDYVFSKGYQLPTLQETEKHIKEKGHLSGIPSAAEVKTNGIELGDMNAKLLQKIEELTLYLIQIKKENDDQQKANQDQNKMLRAEIEGLKSKLNNN